MLGGASEKGFTMSTPEHDHAEAQTPTPSPTSGTDAGELRDPAAESSDREGEAETPAEAESAESADPAEIPDNEQLEEPSTEKEPSEEPKAPKRDDSDPDHEAVGIGVVDGPDA